MARRSRRSRRSKYDWPDDEKLQALLDAHGTAETARRLGCPPSSLSNRIRQRGLRGSKGRRKPDAAEPSGVAIPEPGGESAREPLDASLGERDGRNGSDTAGADIRFDALPSWIQWAHGRESASAKRRVSRHLRRAPSLLLRPLGFHRRVPSTIWGALAVVGLAAVAGLVAFVMVSDDPKTYERESSYAIRPSETVSDVALPDVTGTLAQPDSAVTVSIVDMLGSARVRSYAARYAGLPPSSVAEGGAPYVWSASRRPGSAIVDIRLSGPDDSNLLAMHAAASREADRLVESVFPLFRLGSLSAPTTRKEVDPKVAQTVGLALLLGALLGSALFLLERRLTSSLRARTPALGRDGGPTATPRSDGRGGLSRVPAARGETSEL